jgi:hypothetical protein
MTRRSSRSCWAAAVCRAACRSSRVAESWVTQALLDVKTNPRRGLKLKGMAKLPQPLDGVADSLAPLRQFGTLRVTALEFDSLIRKGRRRFVDDDGFEIDVPAASGTSGSKE